MVNKKGCVFWDLDVCPTTYSAADALSAIRQLAGSLIDGVRGDNLNIRAYWDATAADPDNRQGFTQCYANDLQRMGVTVLETSFLDPGKKEQAMLADIAVEAIDERKLGILIVSDSQVMSYFTHKLQDVHRKARVVSLSELVVAAENVNQVPGHHHAPATAGSPSGAHTSPESSAAAPGPSPHGSEASLYLLAPKPMAPLVKVLEECKADGKIRVEKSVLGNLLLESYPKLYQEVGVKTFKKYLALAETEGIVMEGGGGPQAWVELLFDGTNVGPSNPEAIPADPAIPVAQQSPSSVQLEDDIANLRSRAPAGFGPLVEALERAKREGNPKMDKALLGNKLLKISNTVYQDAGVKDFKRYIALAQEEGIIAEGRGEKHVWVELV
ncbi:hypothetical protein FA15DRAFT_667527 [Coprinopsis marcescibilis]|uniref:NYN domain-containing protein n=1 Tax=Coprinopsis marcescibilis TaxID=230819 RepID=A0A5C3L0Y6_COPMA|nr:hypothetical protein FA15DRAFT_667527 [Coprinopsis marcescibilis]